MNNYTRIILVGIIIVCLFTSCAKNPVKNYRATKVLQDFFEHLAQGEYEDAADLFGGSYETLVAFNPDINPDNYIALWQSGCQVNGLQCLPVRIATLNEVSSKGEYIFSVEFSNPDDTLFVLNACCGGNPVNPPIFQFEYRVIEGGDGQFRVLDLPVYVP